MRGTFIGLHVVYIVATKAVRSVVCHIVLIHDEDIFAVDCIMSPFLRFHDNVKEPRAKRKQKTIALHITRSVAPASDLHGTEEQIFSLPL